MDISIRRGINFGLISGILMATAVIVGLSSSGAAKEVLMAGTLVVAFADAFSDSLGMYLSSNHEDNKNMWHSIALAFFTKIIIASTFLVPLFLAKNSVAMVICIVWAALLLAAIGYYLNQAVAKKEMVINTAKYIIILAVVSIISFYIGTLFKGFYIK